MCTWSQEPIVDIFLSVIERKIWEKVLDAEKGGMNPRFEHWDRQSSIISSPSISVFKNIFVRVIKLVFLVWRGNCVMSTEGQVRH